MADNFKNLLIVVLASMLILFGWRYFFEKPRLEKHQQAHKEYQQQLQKYNALQQKRKKNSADSPPEKLTFAEELKRTDRLKIQTDKLTGSILLKGLRFDDLKLNNYKKDLSDQSTPLTLLAPSGFANTYFAHIGFSAEDADIKTPDDTTLWKTESKILDVNHPAILTWDNGQGLIFKIEISLDNDYMFDIVQTVINKSDDPISIRYYSLVNRTEGARSKSFGPTSHEGFISAVDGKLQEYGYDNIKKNHEKFKLDEVNWFGFADKYWLASFIPDQKLYYKLSHKHALHGGFDKYQSDIVSSPQVVAPSETVSYKHRLFTGAKQLEILDMYEAKYGIKLFDHAIDFGILYIFTKPLFIALNYFYDLVGNFGLSIIIVTILVKLSLGILTFRSTKSMNRMKELQPEIKRLDSLYADDAIKLNQEKRALFKKHNVSPLGCLPALIQIPIFFGFFKVININIEMRHAPFFGWIQDLSAPDPTSIVNLFGLLEFTPPSFLIIGIWPILTALSLMLMQKTAPPVTDENMANMMRFIPLISLIAAINFPAGLAIYFTFSNLFSVIQQLVIKVLTSRKII